MLELAGLELSLFCFQSCLEWMSWVEWFSFSVE